LERFSPEFRERHIEGAACRGFGRGRYVLHGRAQGGRQGLPEDRDRLNTSKNRNWGPVGSGAVIRAVALSVVNAGVAPLARRCLTSGRRPPLRSGPGGFRTRPDGACW
jgi:hypothetical protein